MRRQTAKLLLHTALAFSAWAVPSFAQAYDARIGREAWAMIGRVEYQEGVPLGLLHAMSLAETGMGQDGQLLPWPYTVGINRSPVREYTTLSAGRAELKRLAGLGFTKFDVTVNGRSYTAISRTMAELYLAGTNDLARVKIQGVNYAKRFNTKDQAVAFARQMIAGGHDNLDIGLMQINWRVHGKKFRSVEEVFDVNRNVSYAVSYLREHRETRDWWGSVGRYHSATPYYARNYIKSVWEMYQRVHRLNKYNKKTG